MQLLRYGQLTQLHMNFVYQPLRDAHDLITGVAVVATDVSEQVVAGQLLALANEEMTAANQAVGMHNRELAAINQQLTRTNRDLDNFVYATSHDLKQPVNNLNGLFSELCLSTVFTDPEEQAVLVPMIDAALRQLATTIDDLATVGQAQRQPELPPRNRGPGRTHPGSASNPAAAGAGRPRPHHRRLFGPAHHHLHPGQPAHHPAQPAQ